MKNYFKARLSTSVGLNFPGSPLLMDVIKHIVVFDHSSTEKCLDMRCFIFKISGPSLDVIS